MNNQPLASSFRDPSGFLFTREGVLYRQVNRTYKEHYDFFMSSGLYQDLTASGFLIPHDEVEIGYAASKNAYRVLKPELIEFISYPYEWSFNQLKDAALTTLGIQKRALEHGMSLKDSSGYNIQFRQGRPVFIDTLSFEKYREGEPWVAYRQFCQHFLAPLALMSYRDVRLSRLLRIYIEGVPLDMASTLLPLRTRFNFSLLTHLHLHARSQQYFAGKTVKRAGGRMSRFAFLNLLDNLESAVKKLKWQARGTEWADYYEDTNYSVTALGHKQQLVADFLEKVNPKSVWDLGANIGLFSRIAASKGIRTISFDVDPAAVEKNYLDCAARKETNILPVLIDLTNPSPGIGWQSHERMSLIERGPADAALALALVHHLAISNNLPFREIADFFSRICRCLIIEFVPRNDSQVQRMLANREDIFTDYTREAFEKEFGRRFSIQESQPVKDSERFLYLMVKTEERG